jgi:hypothetical protein
MAVVFSGLHSADSGQWTRSSPRIVSPGFDSPQEEIRCCPLLAVQKLVHNILPLIRALLVFAWHPESNWRAGPAEDESHIVWVDDDPTATIITGAPTKRMYRNRSALQDRRVQRFIIMGEVEHHPAAKGKKKREWRWAGARGQRRVTGSWLQHRGPFLR